MTHKRFLMSLLFGCASIAAPVIALWMSKVQGYVWPLSVVLLVGGLVFTGLLAWGVWRLMSKWAKRRMHKQVLEAWMRKQSAESLAEIAKTKGN
jgi:peptidoglycan/LPS O-acetylase OafA/YrhL